MAAVPDGDKAMARRSGLGRALRQKLDPLGKDCPDASVLAAYFDRELETQEAARWELHFSNCARCQEQLATMARTEPAAELPASKQPAGVRRFWDLRWIVPLATAAAAGALWIALHPTLPGLEQRPVQPEPGAVAPSPAEKGAPATGSARSLAKPVVPGKEMARSRAALAEEKRVAAEDASSGAKTDQVTTALRRVAPAPVARATQNEAVPEGKPREKLEERAASKEPAVFSAAQLQVPPEPALKAKAAPAGAAGAASRESAAVPAALEQAPPKAPGTPAKTVPFERGAPASSRMALLAERAAEVRVVAPGGQAMWRFGPEGTVEHSRDAGKTWKGQFLKDTATLLAGSAPSENVCWVVGAAGTVLRTTDGERWEKVSAPTRANLILVEARDAQHATVTAADGKIYRTEDGGRTWQ